MNCPVAVALFLLLVSSSARAAEPPVVAVFDLEDARRTGRLSTDATRQFSEYLAARLAESGSLRLMPRAQLKEALAKQRLESYKNCYEESCQIEIGKALAAEKALGTRVMKLGKTECAVTSTLYDLRTEVTERVVTAEGGCSEDDVLSSLRSVVAKLGTAAAAPAPPTAPPAPAAVTKAQPVEPARPPPPVSEGRLQASESKSSKSELELSVSASMKSRAPSALLQNARANALLAIAHYSGNDAMAAFERGARSAEEAVRLAGFDVNAPASVQRAGAEALYWWAINMNGFAARKGFSTHLKYKDQILSAMKRVHALDRSIDQSGPDRELGRFYATMSSFAGGDTGRAKEHFETAIRLSPNEPWNRVAFAEAYAVKVQDKDLFVRELRAVLASSDDAIPGREVHTRAAKSRAETLLAQIGDLF